MDAQSVATFDITRKSVQKQALPFFAVSLPYLLGFSIPLMDIDASQYASISLEMLQKGSWLEVFHRGDDYLDKPPLLFWLSAFFYSLFGVADWVYRLPSVLSTILGAFSTYYLGKMLYNRQAGYFAALTLVSCQAWFLINNDVRTDTLLANFTIFGIWQIHAFLQDGKNLRIFWAAIGVAAAMMTKGPIGLMVPVLALGMDWLLHRQWKHFFRWQWLLLLGLVGLLLSPMVYGLYTQFGWEGPRFYFWTQSFGRLTGESEWSNDTSPFFFVHTLAWSFLPWTFLFALSFWDKGKLILRQGFRLGKGQEALTFFGVLLPFLALSMSNYKLPHYIYVFFPLMAILTGKGMDELVKRPKTGPRFQTLKGLQLILMIALWVLVGLLVLVAFRREDAFSFLLMGFFGLGSFLLWWMGPGAYSSLIMSTLLCIVGVNALMNYHVYPELLQYQASSSAAFYTHDKGIEKGELMTFQYQAHALDFYRREQVPEAHNQHELLKMRQRHPYVLTRASNLETLSEMGLDYKLMRRFKDYPVTRLSLPFLNPYTRTKQLKIYALAKLED